MLSSAFITPHPPIIVPGVGHPEDLDRAKKTVFGMKALGKAFAESRPDIIFLVSPHAPAEYGSFGLNAAAILEGDLGMFGYGESVSYENAKDIIREIREAAAAEDLPAHFFDAPLDHGALVPLWYLAKKTKTRLVHAAFSFLDLRTHFRYGKMVGNILRKHPERVAFVASGDLSHRLSKSAPAGYSPRGKEFDEKLVQLVSARDTEGILGLEEAFIEEAGECGLRSIVMLLGALEGMEGIFQLQSYEGPFGVGYCAAQFILV